MLKTEVVGIMRRKSKKIRSKVSPSNLDGNLMIIDEVWKKYVSTLYKVAQLSNKMNNYQIVKILGEGDGQR